ncbi:hypothetical protein BC936DRAFT_140266 [Jimgerdemannia flammicorona]|uniref:Uncharacterized protein n=1 Tax=Jimgerdemannia flammicorona TaxID=994334 RepID=A0A433AVP2_9FUNG|nr:hypothetical protein BC936DRAFT_140266 [Jimgerdemannia flammicorona]
MSTAENGDNDSPKFRPFITPNHKLPKVKRAKYSTSLDPRGYIPGTIMFARDDGFPRLLPQIHRVYLHVLTHLSLSLSHPSSLTTVYEYIINGQAIMWDRETGVTSTSRVSGRPSGTQRLTSSRWSTRTRILRFARFAAGSSESKGLGVIPYEHAQILCIRTAWNIRKELIPLFGPRFRFEALDPSHPDYGCLLLTGDMPTPTKLHPHDHVHDAARPHLVQSHRQSPSPTTPPREVEDRKNDRIVASMSVSRLLNDPTPDEPARAVSVDWDGDLYMHDAGSRDNSIRPEGEEPIDDDDDDDDDESTTPATSDSGIMTPSPTFRVVPRLPVPHNLAHPPKDYHHAHHHNHHHRPAPAPRRNTAPIIMPVLSLEIPQHGRQSGPNTAYPDPYGQYQCHQPPPPMPYNHQPQASASYPPYRRPAHARVVQPPSQDLVETINATILLQQLSQDDGKRPLKPIRKDALPNSVVVEGQMFRIYYD